MENKNHQEFNKTNLPTQSSDLMSVFSKLQNQELISSKEADQILHWVVRETRSILLKILTAERATASTQFNAAVDISMEPLHGRCSFSQCVAAYGLLDRGLNPKPFSAQSLPGFTVGHAMLTLELPTENGPSLYLIDPTYRQFYDPRAPEFEGNPMPGFVLEKISGGAEILSDLLHDGYLKITPDKADKYLASFCKRVSPFSSHEQAYLFMKDPPYDNAYHWFNKETMERNGHSIPRSFVHS